MEKGATKRLYTHLIEARIQPQIDQGFGLADTHSVAGFPSADSYRLGFAYPYARVQRHIVRQTIDLGGETQEVDADISQFAGLQTANRLVLTIGNVVEIGEIGLLEHDEVPSGQKPR